MTATVLIIGGPTASGKSGLALDIAARHNGVVINADSMQIYDGLPILTAQPSAADKNAAPHLLYSALQPQEICTAAHWRDMALQAIDETLQAKKRPVIVGGTGFYIKTLMAGISPIPEVPADVRARGIALQQEMGNPAFHEALKERDPATAAKLDPMNTQRNVRAWEVLEATGVGLAEWHETPPVPPPAHLDFKMIALLPPRDALYQNCDRRFDIMLESGAIDETRDFRARMKGAPSPLDKALGYAELLNHIDGKITIDEARAQAAQMTRNYAKRQTTWFRNQIKADLVLESPNAAQAAALLS